MLPTEREHLAEQAVIHIGNFVPGMELGAMHADALKHNLLAMLVAVDAAVGAASTPVLFTEIVPGYDLLAIWPEAATPKHLATPVEEVDVRASIGLSADTVTMLGTVFAQVFNENVLDVNEEVCGWASQDNVQYVAFPVYMRDRALRAVGVTVN